MNSLSGCCSFTNFSARIFTSVTLGSLALTSCQKQQNINSQILKGNQVKFFAHFHEVGKVFLEHFDMLEIFSKIFSSGHGLPIGYPGCDFICFLQELCSLLSIYESLSFSGRGLNQFLPQSRYLLQSCLSHSGGGAKTNSLINFVVIILLGMYDFEFRINTHVSKEENCYHPLLECGFM